MSPTATAAIRTHSHAHNGLKESHIGLKDHRMAGHLKEKEKGHLPTPDTLSIRVDLPQEKSNGRREEGETTVIHWDEPVGFFLFAISFGTCPFLSYNLLTFTLLALTYPALTTAQVIAYITCIRLLLVSPTLQHKQS